MNYHDRRHLREEYVPFLPPLVQALKEWFPQLDGRAFAISGPPDLINNKENMPTLPFVLCALGKCTGSSTQNTGSVYLEDNFFLQFWLPPSRKHEFGGETPFWTYVPYEIDIRNTLFDNFPRWQTPNDVKIKYKEMHVTSNAYALQVTFGFVACLTLQQCPEDYGERFTVSFCLCPPPGVCRLDQIMEPPDAPPPDVPLPGTFYSGFYLGF